MRTVLLLFASNIFMTIAWYGHLKYTKAPLLAAILLSWLIALPEYSLQVPANRLGYLDHWSAAQLKIVQEAVGLIVFSVFAVGWLREPIRWNVLVAFGFILVAVWFAFWFPRPAGS